MLGHRGSGGGHARIIATPDLLTECQDTRAQRFGQQEYIPGVRDFERRGLEFEALGKADRPADQVLDHGRVGEG